MERGVGERLGGDLGESVQHRRVVEVAQAVGEHLREADHLGAGDERDHEAGAIAEPAPLGALELAGAPVGLHVGHRDRLPALHGQPRDVHVGDAVGRAGEDRVGGVVGLDARQAHLDVAPEGVDVAAGRLGGDAHARRHRTQDVVHLEAGAELEAGVDELAQLAVAVLQAAQQQRLLEGAGEELADAAHEVEMLGEGALARVFDVDHGEGFAVHDERDRKAALQAPAPVPVDLGGRQPGIVGRGDDPGSALRERRGVARVLRERRPPAVVVVVKALWPDADELHELPSIDPVDLAEGSVEGHEQPQRRQAQELADVGHLRHQLAELYQVAQGGVAALELAQQHGVLGGAGQHRREALQEVGELDEVARPRVEDVEKADGLPVDHERHADLALVVELGVALALVGGQPGVGRRGDDQHLTARQRRGAAGKVADVARPADPGVDQAVAVEAGQQLDPVALQRVELAGVGVDRLDQPRAQ